MRRRSGLVLVRKTGFRSGYSLASLYPSYRKGGHHQGSRGEWVAPIRLDLRLLSRRLRRTRLARPPMTLDQAAAIVDGHGWQRKGANRAHYFFAGTRVACGNRVDLTSAEFDEALPTADIICRRCATELRTAQAMTGITPTSRSTP